MEIKYLFTSDQGDVPVDQETLQRPFLVRPFEKHPFFTLGDFFRAVGDFFLQCTDRDQIDLPGSFRGGPLGSGRIDSLLIRYEKYGSLYQMASVEVPAGEHRTKYAVSAALAPEAKAALDYEFELLKGLNGRYRLPYLPEVYFKDDVGIQKEGMADSFVMSLSEWFEGFHEWHFTGDYESGRVMIIWDQEKGYRNASPHETLDIIRQASKILTLYYDTETYQQIFPWHHAAGDFVVRPGKDGVDVRLVTAREYDPIVSSVDGQDIDPLTAISYFFLNMTIKMRLDKSEGMGEPVWAPPLILRAVTEGFLEAVRAKTAREKSEYRAGSVESLMKILRAMSEKSIRNRVQALTLSYRQQDPVDYEVIQRHSEDHAGEVYRAIRESL